MMGTYIKEQKSKNEEDVTCQNYSNVCTKKNKRRNCNTEEKKDPCLTAEGSYKLV